MWPRVVTAKEAKVSPVWLLPSANGNSATLPLVGETNRFLLQDDGHTVKPKRKRNFAGGLMKHQNIKYSHNLKA